MKADAFAVVGSKAGAAATRNRMRVAHASDAAPHVRHRNKIHACEGRSRNIVRNEEGAYMPESVLIYGKDT